MSRKLVTVRQVSAIDPIVGADAIECITIEGWKVVSQKGNYKVGDYAVYFEIDSFLPDGDVRWQDLVDKSGREFDGKRGHRLRTIKLRGQVSQGFSIPLSKFPEIQDQLPINVLSSSDAREAWSANVREMDFADLLGVVKWDPPLPAELAGVAKGLFPSFIRKTDQERVQNIPDVVNDKSSEYEATVKLDGSSLTVFFNAGEVGVCSRNLEMSLEDSNKDNTLVKIARESDLLRVLAEMGRNIAVQGELMGPNIQGNREQFKTHQFWVFDIFDIDAQQYLAPEARRELFDEIATACGSPNKLYHVPVLHADFNLGRFGLDTIEQILEFAEGPSVTHPTREGLVFKRKDGLFSFKAISNRFLLKEKD